MAVTRGLFPKFPLYLFALVLACAACSSKPDMPVLGSVPEFSLTERSARTVTRADLEGKVWIADFIFTRCSGMCPDMTGKMRRLQEKLPAEIHLVSFSVDPEHDTPDILSTYAAKGGADSKRWLFLTGDKDSLYSLSKNGFKLAVSDEGGTPIEPITHSSRFVLVDRKGQIRGYYGMEDADALDRLMTDAPKLL